MEKLLPVLLASALLAFFSIEELQAQPNDPNFNIADAFLSTAGEYPPFPIEEILIIERRPQSALRIEIRNLENDIYGILNSLIDDENFKMTCEYTRRTATYSRQRICLPGFVGVYRRQIFGELEVMNNNASYTVVGRGFLNMGKAYTTASNTYELRSEWEQYSAMVSKLAAQNPRLTEHIVKRHKIIQVYENNKKNWWTNLFRRNKVSLASK